MYALVHFKYLLIVVLVVCTGLVTASDDFPPGHLQPLGHHMPPLHIDTLDTVPDPVTFYREYVESKTPVKFKGLLRNKEVMTTWQSDDYLREHFGDSTITMEPMKKENRSLFSNATTLSDFLNRYKTEEIYMATEIPPAMSREWPLPSVLSCGGYTNHLSIINVWFSSGGTKSVVHTDTFENLHCLVSGYKRFILIEAKYSTEIGPEHAKLGYFNIDVEAVDMTKYPGLAKVPWYETIIEEGDCLYLPYMWLHQVNSYGNRNMGVNVWWIPFDFVEDDCSGGDVSEPSFLGDFEVAPELEIKWFLSTCKRDDGTIHTHDVYESLKKHMPNLQLETVKRIMEILVPNSNGVIHERDLSLDVTPIERFKEAMEYAMERSERGEPIDNEFEGGGDGSIPEHESHDEL